jgi:hypothetical protein
VQYLDRLPADRGKSGMRGVWNARRLRRSVKRSL